MRKKRAPKRSIAPDSKFGNVLIAKFINNLMRRGKKHLARHIFYQSLEVIGERSKQSPLDVFKKAVDNVRPVLEVRARRVGGATYQVPTEVRPDRSVSLAMRWLISYANERKEKGMPLKLAGEFLDAASNQGNAVKKKEDTHKMAEANKAFAHFRW